MKAGQRDRGALAILRRESQIARAEGELARREAFPEVMAWAGYRIRSQALEDGGDDFISLGVRVPLPLDHGDGRDADIRGAQLRAQAAEERHEGSLRALEAELVQCVDRWRRAHAQAMSYESSLLPLGSGVLERERSAFEVGGGGVDALYEAEVTLLELTAVHRRAVAQTHIEDATLRALIGGV